MMILILTLFLIGISDCEETNKDNVQERTIVPRVPGSRVSDDRVEDRRDYYDYEHRDDDYDRYSPFYTTGDGPCEALIERLKEELQRDQSTISVYSDNDRRRSAKVVINVFIIL